MPRLGNPLATMLVRFNDKINTLLSIPLWHTRAHIRIKYYSEAYAAVPPPYTASNFWAFVRINADSNVKLLSILKLRRDGVGMANKLGI